MLTRTWTGVGCAAVLALGLGLTTNGARAEGGATRSQCVADARAEARTCTQLCRDDFLATKDACRDLDHDCAEAARTERTSCVGDVLSALAACVVDECGEFATQIAQCRETYPVGDPQRDACVDNAQLLRFQCRDACRESVQLHAGLRACRVEFRSAIQACKEVEPGM
jgi:hypothetical protein